MAYRSTRSSDAHPLASWHTVPQESLASLTDPPKSVLARPLFWVRQILSHRSYNEWIWAYFFLIPGLIFFTLFTLYPVLRSIILSMNRINAYYDAPRFVAFNNYSKILRDNIWWAALKNTGDLYRRHRSIAGLNISRACRADSALRQQDAGAFSGAFSTCRASPRWSLSP